MRIRFVQFAFSPPGIPAPAAPAAALAALAALIASGCGANETSVEPNEPTAPTRSTAWLERDRESHDFGVVYPDSLHEVNFGITVAGEGEVVVDELVRSCGCTEGKLRVVGEAGELESVEFGAAYPVGTRFDLLATLNTKGKHGVQEQKVHVVLDGSEEMQTYKLMASIEPFLECDPAVLDVGRFSTLEGASATARLASHGGVPFGVRAESLPDSIEVSFEPVDPGPEGRATEWLVNATILPGAGPGVASHRWFLVSDVTNEHSTPNAAGDRPTHRREAWIRGVVEGAVTARPERMDFGRLEAGRVVTRKVVLENHDADFELGELQVRVEEQDGSPARDDLMAATEVSARKLSDGRRWELEVTVADLQRSGKISGQVHLRIGHRFQDDLYVPFQAQVPEPVVGQGE